MGWLPTAGAPNVIAVYNIFFCQRPPDSFFAARSIQFFICVYVSPSAESQHRVYCLQVAEKVRRLEEEALGQKDWFMKGEVPAGAVA